MVFFPPRSSWNVWKKYWKLNLGWDFKTGSFKIHTQINCYNFFASITFPKIRIFTRVVAKVYVFWKHSYLFDACTTKTTDNKYGRLFPNFVAFSENIKCINNGRSCLYLLSCLAVRIHLIIKSCLSIVIAIYLVIETSIMHISVLYNTQMPWPSNSKLLEVFSYIHIINF